MDSNKVMSGYSNLNRMTISGVYDLNKQTSLQQLIAYCGIQYTNNFYLYASVIRAKEYLANHSNEKAVSFQQAKSIFNNIHEQRTALVRSLSFSRAQEIFNAIKQNRKPLEDYLYGIK